MKKMNIAGTEHLMENFLRERLLKEAVIVAHHAHRNQTYDIFPYSYHIDMVVDVGKDMGFPIVWLAGCALHDVVEDCDLSISKIEKVFGEEIAYIVACVTDPIDLANRKLKKARVYQKLNRACDRGILGPLAVKLADRYANGNHSRRFGGGQYQMYVKEYNNFRQELYRETYGAPELEEIIAKLWTVLDHLFNFKGYDGPKNKSL